MKRSNQKSRIWIKQKKKENIFFHKLPLSTQVFKSKMDTFCVLVNWHALDLIVVVVS